MDPKQQSPEPATAPSAQPPATPEQPTHSAVTGTPVVVNADPASEALQQPVVGASPAQQAQPDRQSQQPKPQSVNLIGLVDPDDKSPRVSQPTKSETVREVLSTIGVLLAALLVAFGLIAWVFQSYEVDGPSMDRTLNNHDRLIVWKVPRTIAKITGNPYIPNRGDIVIFTEGGLSQFGSTESKQLIKRVIALPGERLVIKDGVITVYNAANPDGIQPDKTMSYGKTFNPDPRMTDMDIRLTDNQLFVCGDNRPNSLDSRTFGPIEAEQIVGKLAIRLLPVNQIEKF